MVVTQGKTKQILKGPEEHTVYLKTFDILTGGDAAKKESIDGISVDKTTQTANVFQLLNSKGIPTAFIARHSDDTLLCHGCDMLPLEFVVRRLAVGSYLLRHPSYKQDGRPHRFDPPFWEVFHKLSVIATEDTDSPYMVEEETARRQYLKDGKWQDGVYTDPLIEPKDGKWLIHPQKKEFSADNVLLEAEPLLSEAELHEVIHGIVLPTFLALEEAWQKVQTVHGPVELVDMKVELGRRKQDGKLVLADVIDNDSWRIWPGGKKDQQLDKQCFREDNPLGQVSDNYKMVAQLTAEFLK